MKKQSATNKEMKITKLNVEKPDFSILNNNKQWQMALRKR